MKTILNIALACFFMAGLCACRKEKAYFDEALVLADIPVFVNNSILGVKLGTKLNGIPLEDYKGVYQSGTGKFTFYNKNTGEILLEQTFELKPELKDTLYLFQPDSTVAPKLIENTQKDELAAPEGYMKIKMANLSKMALSDNNGMAYSKLDVVLSARVTTGLIYSPVDTLIGIGGDLDTASYYLVKLALNRSGVAQLTYRLSFLDHQTQAPILNSGGTVFTSLTSALSLSRPSKPPGLPQPWGQQVYTFYITDIEKPSAGTAYVLKDGRYWDFGVGKLF